MSECRKIQRNMPALLLGELAAKDRERAERHIEGCRECRRKLSEMRAVLEGAEAFRREVEAASEKVDWDATAERITDRVLSGEGEPFSNRPRRIPAAAWKRARLRPVFAALLLGAVLGAGVMWTALRMTRPSPPAAAAAGLPQDVLDGMTLELARRETLDYLQKSRYLLLDFIQSPADRSAEFWRGEFAASRTRDLLSRKKFIDPQLDQFKMAKAKAICDQIEWLFLELTQISGELSTVELERLRGLIEERQLLLKINLVEKELGQSEV